MSLVQIAALPVVLGGLNFAYLDSSENKQYRCQAYNKILRKYSTSKPWTVSVSGCKFHETESFTVRCQSKWLNCSNYIGY